MADFVRNYRKSQEAIEAEAERVKEQAEKDTKTLEEYEKAKQDFLTKYFLYRRKKGLKDMSEDAQSKMFDEFISKAGAQEGRLNSDSSDLEKAAYGMEVLKDMGDMYDDENLSFSEYYRRTSPNTYATLKDFADNPNEAIRSGKADQYKALLALAQKKYADYRNADSAVFDMFENPDKFTAQETSTTTEKTDDGGVEEKATEKEVVNQNNDTEEDSVEFSYKPGDTFGQKIIDLGLATDNGLWGDNGDVAFYTRQLIDQNALDERGNVKLGQTFKLKRRK